MRFFHLLIAGFYLLTILLAGGCKNVDKYEGRMVFRYNEDAGIGALDPAFARSQAEIWVVSQLFNTLVELDDNLQPRPALARSWQYMAERSCYRFSLRSGVQFHPNDLWLNNDERLLKASDVVYSLRRLADPATASPGAWILNDKIDKRRKDHWIEATDDTTVLIYLNNDYPQFISQLAMNYAMILPEKLMRRGLSPMEKPVGSGPFRFAYLEPEVRMVLLKNDEYWETDSSGIPLPYLDAVNIDLIRSKQTAFMKFVSGEYDFFNGFDAGFKDDLLTRDGTLSPRYADRFHALTWPFLNTEYIGFYLGESQRGHPVQNKSLRQALAYAIDRENLVRYLRNGVGDAGNYGFVPPVLLGKKVSGYHYNRKKAIDLLTQAGFPGGKGIPILEINTTADYADMAVYIQNAWQQIGVRSEIAVHPGGHLRQMRNKGAIAIFRGSWIADYADAENYLSCFTAANRSPAGPNYTHYSGTEFDNLYQQSMTESDTWRLEMMALMDSTMMQECPLIVLYYDRSVRLFQKNVKGLGNNAMNQLGLKKVWLENTESRK